MVTPTIIPRAEHSLSRSLIDPDALKVLSRLRQFDYVAYLVGGCVRDLLLGREPKDFDVVTNATRTRSSGCSATAGSSGGAFGWRTSTSTKTIEVATFRSQAADEPETADQEAAAEAAEQRQRPGAAAAEGR